MPTHLHKTLAHTLKTHRRDFCSELFPMKPAQPIHLHKWTLYISNSKGGGTFCSELLPMNPLTHTKISHLYCVYSPVTRTFQPHFVLEQSLPKQVCVCVGGGTRPFTTHQLLTDCIYHVRGQEFSYTTAPPAQYGREGVRSLYITCWVCYCMGGILYQLGNKIQWFAEILRNENLLTILGMLSSRLYWACSVADYTGHAQ